MKNIILILISLSYIMQGSVFLAIFSAISFVIISIGVRYLNATGIADQPIREFGPETHLSKKNTPTMGGLLIISPICFLIFSYEILQYVLIGKFQFECNILASFIILAGFGVLGYYDDMLKVRYKNHNGISALKKLFAQFLIALGAMIVVAMGRQKQIINGITNISNTSIWIPFLEIEVYIGIIGFVLLGTIIIISTSNAFNLTDGVDGLASSVGSVIICMYYLYMNSDLLSRMIVLQLLFNLIVFLRYNSYPAKIFMGDVGSLPIGAYIGFLSVVTHTELSLPVIAIIPVVETLSVMLQVYFYRKYKKRIFLMTPIHHHFEKLGWSESEIVKRFTIITIIASLIWVQVSNKNSLKVNFRKFYYEKFGNYDPTSLI